MPSAPSPPDDLTTRRLARDVHDVLGHHLSAIAVHADLGRRRLADGDDAAVEESLSLIRAAAAEALLQTRDWIGLDRPLLDPPLADRLERLALPARVAGVEVRVSERGASGPLPPQLSECVERIVQESLTNVLRHAAATHVDVVVRHRDADLQVTIVNDGRPRRGEAMGVGRGLAGMRERAAEVGGRLLAGPGARGGWRVSARLPR